MARYPFNSTLEMVSAAIAVGATLYMLWTWRRRKSFPSLRVGTVSNIFMYPIKSVPGLNIQEALCTAVGLEQPQTEVRDRSYIITSSNYNFISLRQEPSLALLKVSIVGHEMLLEAPNMEPLCIDLTDFGEPCTVKVFNQPVSALDCGEKASQWLSAFLKKDGIRLCRDSPPGPLKRFLKDFDEEPLKTFLQRAKEEDHVTFSDVSPFMVVSDASLEDLNSRMDTTLTMRTFRPNITVSGCPPFDEDTWRVLEIGEARFTFVVHCSRCSLTQVNPDTGTRRKDEEPLKTLRKYRLIDPAFQKSPCFGTQWVLDKPGVIRAGDPVYVSKA